MVVFEDLSKKVQNIIKRYQVAKRMLEKAKEKDKKCRADMIHELCEKQGITKENIVFAEEKYEMVITGALRSGDTAWAKVWKDFDTMFFKLIKDNDSLAGEYLRCRRAAELNNQKAPYLRWEVRGKNGTGESTDD